MKPKQGLIQTFGKILTLSPVVIVWVDIPLDEWDQIVRYSRSQGLGAPLFCSLKERASINLPPNILERLRMTYFDTLRRNTLLFLELDRVLVILGEAGIQAVV